MPQDTEKLKAHFVVDPLHSFMPVHCEQLKKNKRHCNSFLGEFEVSRPNIAKFYCQTCKVLYRYTVNEDQIVEYEETEDVTLDSHPIVKVKKCTKT